MAEKQTSAAKPRRGAGARSNTAPQKLELLITVINRSKAEFYLDLLQSFEVNLQFSSTANGTAGSERLALMGLQDNEKRMLFSVVRADKVSEILAVLEEKFNTIKNGKGVAWAVPLTNVIGVSTYRFLANNRRGIREEKT